MNSIGLSIIVVHFETPDYTSQCLHSIYANPPTAPFEILLIDNGSSDGSLGMLEEEFPSVRAIRIGENVGFARANNLGLNNARGEYVLLLNSDTRIVNGSLDRLLNRLKSNPEIGAVGPKQFDGDGKLQLSWGQFPTFISEALRQLLHYRLSINDQAVRGYLEEKYAGSSRVDWVSGSCLMARKKALEAIGYLDPHFFMYFEDIDLCRRLERTGWKVHYDSDTTIVHYGGISARKNILHVLIEYRHSQIYFTRKYYGWKGVFLLKVLLFVKYGMNLGRWITVFAIEKLLRRDAKASYAKLLLSKKTVELVFKSDRIRVASAG